MTETELQKSHDAMARFLLYLCRYSDAYIGECNRYSGRTVEVEEHYQKARRLIKRAGFSYNPSKIHEINPRKIHEIKMARKAIIRTHRKA
jgi:hypothetical protein